MERASGGWVLIDYTGRELAGPFDEVSQVTGDMAGFRTGKRWGYIDRDGHKVIAPRFEQAEPFFDGVAAVSVKGRYGLVDTKGKFVVQPQYEILIPVPGDLLFVMKSGRWSYRTRGGREIWATRQKFPGPR